MLLGGETLYGAKPFGIVNTGARIWAWSVVSGSTNFRTQTELRQCPPRNKFSDTIQRIEVCGARWMTEGIWTAIGLMSGTSMDGVDAALVKTDGRAILELGVNLTRPYEQEFRQQLRDIISGRGDINAVEVELTGIHVATVFALLREAEILAMDIDVIGFHGHTIQHNPENGSTWQLGDGAVLSRDTGIDVVYDLRAADVAGGGQGAPLAPVFHRALSVQMTHPLAVLNIGGVANVTWIGNSEDDLIGFDTGPGNALIDDWALRHTGQPCDLDGRLAAAGRVSPVKLARLMAHPYFNHSPPKSLDRDAFNHVKDEALEGLSIEAGAATLPAFTVESIIRASCHFPAPPQQWIVVGGGRHNRVIMKKLTTLLGTDVLNGDQLGWNSDAIEAQAFAYMAVRSRLGLANSYPATTGVIEPTVGGVHVSRP